MKSTDEFEDTPPAAEAPAKVSITFPGGETVETDAATLKKAADHLRGKSAGAPTATVGGIAGDILKSYIERIERLEEEKKALAADIREVYAEAKGNGFEPKIMRKLITLRKMDQADRTEEEELLDLYRRAVGV